MELFTHIQSLYFATTVHSAPIKGAAMKQPDVLTDAWMVIDNGKVVANGHMHQTEVLTGWLNTPDIQVTPCNGRLIFPAFSDSHTHIVYAGSRESEFVDKIQGKTYAEIFENGGGILNSAKRLQNTPAEVLVEQAYQRLQKMMRWGTAAVEIKSGYGLTVDDELKMLRVIRTLKSHTPQHIKATFLGAHAIPEAYKNNRSGYIQLITSQMIPQIADEGLADYCDVFCDKGFFTPEETTEILEAASKYGLKAKLHANELDYSGGIQVGVQHHAISVDHLEFTGEAEIQALLNSHTIPTLLPSTAFFLRLHYPPARQMIDAGLGVALATDYNPGSSPSGNMFFTMALACIQLKMLPEEALTAAVVNGAFAMEVQDQQGCLAPGRSANFIITPPVPSLAYLPYSFGETFCEKLYINGKRAS